MNTIELFDATPEGRRRSILFAIGIMTAFISIVAATSTFVLASGNWPVTLTLGACGLVALGFAVMLYLGWFTWLTDNDQLFWRFSG